MKHRWFVYSFALVLQLTSGQAQADEFLKSFAGNWTGSGWARSLPDASREIVRCKVRNIYSVSTSTLSLTGRCATPGKNSLLRATIRTRSESSTYSGRLYDPEGSGSTELIGRRKGSSVILQFRVRPKKTGQTLAGTMFLHKKKHGFRLSSTGKVGDTGKLGALSNIDFRR